MSSWTFCKIAGRSPFSCGITTSSVFHCRFLAFLACQYVITGLPFDWLTQIENGRVNIARLAMVKRMIVPEYGGMYSGNGIASARSRKPSEACCITSVVKARGFPIFRERGLRELCTRTTCRLAGRMVSWDKISMQTVPPEVTSARQRSRSHFYEIASTILATSDSSCG